MPCPCSGTRWGQRTLFAEQAPDIQWRTWPGLGDPSEICYLAAWQAPENFAELLPAHKRRVDVMGLSLQTRQTIATLQP